MYHTGRGRARASSTSSLEWEGLPAARRDSHELSRLEIVPVGRRIISQDGADADAVIDEALDFRGRGSLRATTAPDGTGSAQVYDRRATPGVPALGWIRVFVRAPDPAALDAEVMWLLINEEPYYGVIVSIIDGGRVALRSWSAPDFYDVTTSSRLEADRWTCLEARVSPDAPIGLWLDGEPVPGIEVPEAAITTGLLVTHIGLYRAASTGAPVSMWFDELALGEERIGCDR